MRLSDMSYIQSDKLSAAVVCLGKIAVATIVCGAVVDSYKCEQREWGRSNASSFFALVEPEVAEMPTTHSLLFSRVDCPS